MRCQWLVFVAFPNVNTDRSTDLCTYPSPREKPASENLSNGNNLALHCPIVLKYTEWDKKVGCCIAIQQLAFLAHSVVGWCVIVPWKRASRVKPRTTGSFKCQCSANPTFYAFVRLFCSWFCRDRAEMTSDETDDTDPEITKIYEPVTALSFVCFCLSLWNEMN